MVHISTKADGKSNEFITGSRAFIDTALLLKDHPFRICCAMRSTMIPLDLNMDVSDIPNIFSLTLNFFRLLQRDFSGDLK